MFLNYGGTVLPVPFLELAENLVETSFDLLYVIIGKLAPLLFEVAFDLHPFPLELICIHGSPLQCEMTLFSVLPIMTG